MKYKDNYNSTYYRIQTQQNNKELDRLLSFVWYNSNYTEEWREIKQTNGNYFISNKGRVISLHHDKFYLLNPYLDKGYYCISLVVNGLQQKVRVNRLVALAFLPNPDKKPIVHHKDFNKLNNNIDNLLWVNEEEHRLLHSRKEGEL